MSEVTVEQLEQQLKSQQGLVDLRDAAIKLSGNREFKKLILDGFMLTESARYAQESGDPMLSDRERADALNMAQAAGHLKRFLQITILRGNTAARDIGDLNVALDESRAGEGEE